MSFAFPTVADFKTQFLRDFPYAITAWGAKATPTVVAGVITLVTVTDGGRGYAAKPSVTALNSPVPVTGAMFDSTISNGKVTAITVVSGGSGYTTPSIEIEGGAGDDTDLTKVTDEDIEGAQVDAQFNINECLFQDEATWKRAFCYLQAHMLVEKVAAATQGLQSQYNWITNAKAVGNVSESYSIPKDVLENPFLAGISRTRYGAIYLTIIAPMLVGNMMTSFRQSMP